ncbi:MAG: UDP-N-acetylmuramoyl-tripeptide--D-alanyl-D-alanine ligase [Treponema sp.]|nr:UDP-N-acetylmuramoyl-tripeptide--D-alanyl-D-alanine ligase [Treponema sp.]
MEMLMSFSGLSQALGVPLLTGEGRQTDTQGFSSVSLDSREISPGGLFVALRGSLHDGHRYVEAAFAAGARGAMVAASAMEDPSLGLLGAAQKWKGFLLVVEDTLKGLQDAAGAYLKQFTNLLTIGITGSAGKTTTKEISAAIIGQEKSVVMNQGNLNSETGLPLSVFNVRSHHEVGIFEAGMNRRGEISELAKVLNPRLALITNIGTAHIGILGTKDAIAEEKKQIFSQFTHNNTALIPAEDPYRDFLAAGLPGRVVFYGPSSLKGLGACRDLGLLGTEITWESKTARFGLPGPAMLQNALAAAALASEMGLGPDSIRRGLESVKPLFGRGEIFQGRTTLIRDCYNSSPESARSALDFCDSLDWPGRRIYVIGSMLELGDSSAEAHGALGRRLVSSKGDMVYLFGEETKAAAEIFESEEKGIPFFHTQDMEHLSRALNEYIQPGDLVLLKGSRGCALESLTKICLGEDHVL